MFSTVVTKNLLKEQAKILGLDSTLSFVFMDLICLSFLVFFDIYNESYSIPCSFGIIFVFHKKCLVEIYFIDSGKFVYEVFVVIFEFLEKCFFRSWFFASNEFTVQNAFLLN